jgi:mannan polymerase II complex ANP1 subunit
MEQERLAREKEEEEKAEKAKKIKEQFGDANSQWEKDKSDMENLASTDKGKGSKAS